MKVIYKYSIPIRDNFTIDLPEGTEILGVATQRGVPVMWALVDTENPSEGVPFHVVGTGHPINPVFEGNFIGSFQLVDGDFIGHLFQGAVRP